MAKMPDPVKKSSKSAVSRGKAIAKASAAEAKASRGEVASKSRYPKMSTAKGASDAASRGRAVDAAKARRAAGGGFGKTENKAPTASDRAGSKANVKRAAEANRASQRSKAAATAKSVGRSAAVSKASASAKGGRVGSAMDKRANSFVGADARRVENTIKRASVATKRRGTLPKTK